MLLVDILFSILSNIISDDIRRILDERKYRKAVEKRIRALHDRVSNVHGEDGVALLGQAAECIAKAEFSREQIVESALNQMTLYLQLKQKPCYLSAIRSMPLYDQDRFNDFCYRILGFICRELPRLDSVHREIAAEMLRKTDETHAKIDVLTADLGTMRAGLSRQSEAERQRNEMEARDILASIEQHLLVYDFELSYDNARRLLEWLERRGEDQSNYLISRIYITLAEVETVKAKNKSDLGAQADFSSARSYLEISRSADTGQEKDRIDALDAYISALEQGPDTGLQMLAKKNDPQSIRRKLMILRNSDRVSEAATLVRGLNLNELWCEQAAFVLAADGQRRSSERLLNWCRSIGNKIIRDRCLLGYAHGTYERLIKKYLSAGTVGPILDILDEDNEILKNIGQAVKPIQQTTSARGHINSQLEAWAIEIALWSELQLGNEKDYADLADLLATYKPIPLVLARLALAQQIDMPSELVVRLRSEHPDLFEAKLMAVAIERELLNRPKVAFDSAMDLVGQATQPEQRERLCGLLVEISQDLDDEAYAEVKQIVPSLLSNNDRFLIFLEIDSLLRTGQTEQANTLLEAIKDESDPTWLQISANLLAQVGDAEKSLDRLLKAADIMQHPDVLWRASAMAHHLGRLNDAAAVLEKYVTLRSRDIRGRTNLAMLYMDIGDFHAAAQEFAELQEREPDNLSHAFNCAISLAARGDTDEASAVLDLALKDKNVPLQFLLQRVELEKAIGQPQDALVLLEKFKEHYWNQPEFLLEFIHIGFAAGDESAAHEAFLQLQQLQSQGKTKPDILHQLSLDDFVDRVKQHKEIGNKIHQGILKGQASWLMADEFFGRVPYLGWWIRTQPVNWLGDDPVYHAEHTIYSTNAFAIEKDERGLPSLDHIKCPPIDTPVVADLSSLITLHRLGFLKAAADYFGKVIIPAAYQLSVLYDSSRLVLHQLSTKRALDEIKTLIDNKRIVVDNHHGTARTMPHIDEYVGKNDGDHVYRLRDLLEALLTAGRIKDELYHELLRVAQKPIGADNDHPSISIRQEVLIELSSLRTLSQAGALQNIVDEFSVHITSQDSDEVISNLNALRRQQEVRKWHLDLWKTIREDKRFVSIAHFIPPELRHDKDESHFDLCIAAYLLAGQIGVPLLVDDREFQKVSRSENQASPQATFSTDRLLIALRESRSLTEDELTEALLQLMKWRYKFVITPAEVLKHVADKFAHPPGKTLQEIAVYVHDCMRDPGLFAGFEPTEPPQMMAFHLFCEWISNIVDFVMQVWADDAYDIKRAKAITEWAMTDFLPTVPKAFAPWFRTRVAESVRNMVFSRSVLRSITVKDSERANKAIQVVAQALGVDPRADEYRQLMSDVIDSTNWTSLDSKDIDELVRSLILQSTFAHTAIDGRTATVLLKNGFPIEVRPDHLSEHLVLILENSKHPDRCPVPPGPMIAYKNKKGSKRRVVTSVKDYLFSPERRIRQAACSHFEMLRNGRPKALSDYSIAVISTLKADLLSDDDSKWRSAALKIADSISDDFLCNLAGVRQGLEMRLQQIPYLPKVLRPSISSLSSLQLIIGKPSAQHENIRRIVEECIGLPELSEACDCYYEQLGHLPLAGRLSFASMVEEWLKSHKNVQHAWTPIWDWANEVNNPVARYLACSVFLLRPCLTPQANLPDLWEEIFEIVCPFNNGTDLKWSKPWSLWNQLSKHYEAYIECAFSGADSEQTSVTSLWLANNVCEVLATVPELRSFFLNEVSNELQISNLCKSIIHPLVTPSELRYAIQYMPSLWSLSLLCMIGPHNLQYIDPAEVNLDVLIKIGEGVLHNMLRRLSMRPKPSDHAIYGFELSLIPAVSISTFLEEGSSLKQALKSLEPVTEGQGSGELAESLRTMSTQSTDAQYLLVNNLLTMAYFGELPEDILWNWISQASWVKDVLLAVDTNVLYVLLDVILELQAQNGEKWANNVPHLFAYACEEATDDIERRTFLFSATIISSIVSDTVSAINRLLCSQHRPELQSEVSHWQAQLQRIQVVTPPWIAAKLRATSASMHLN